ncbi:unnamed protein product [Peniophora sp. CBMAI 1063]|nr:unnamed protein product [Peniophora sp. CBMAI 1063]
MESTSAAFHKDGAFYIESVVFQAGTTLFKVPVYYLPKGEGVFQDLLALPNHNKEGNGDSNPITLPAQITAEDFHSFLNFIMPAPIHVPPRKVTIPEWSSVFQLSSMWCLEVVRVKALADADKQVIAVEDPVTLVLMGKDHHVARWLVEGYKRLCVNPQFLKREEQIKIGFETVSRLAEIRERSWKWASTAETQHIHRYNARNGVYTAGTVQVSTRDRLMYDFTRAIHQLFEDELLLDKTYVSPFRN